MEQHGPIRFVLYPDGTAQRPHTGVIGVIGDQDGVRIDSPSRHGGGFNVNRCLG